MPVVFKRLRLSLGAVAAPRRGAIASSPTSVRRRQLSHGRSSRGGGVKAHHRAWCSNDFILGTASTPRSSPPRGGSMAGAWGGTRNISAPTISTWGSGGGWPTNRQRKWHCCSLRASSRRWPRWPSCCPGGLLFSDEFNHASMIGTFANWAWLKISATTMWGILRNSAATVLARQRSSPSIRWMEI